MTLIIAAIGEYEEEQKKKPFIIMGADDRIVITSSSGVRSESCGAEKLFKLSKYCGVLIADDGVIGKTLIERFKMQYKDKKLVWVSEIVEEFSKFSREMFKNSIGFPQIPSVIFIFAGFDKENEELKPKIFVLWSGDGFLVRSSIKPYEIQGQPWISLYKFEKEYEKAKFSIDKLSRLVCQSIFDTHRINSGNVGKPTWYARIDEEGFKSHEELGIEVKDLYDEW